MSSTEPQAFDLTDAEATALAKRLIAEHLTHNPDWLQWEILPELGEYAFERLAEAVDTEVRALMNASRAHDMATQIDSQWLKGRAQWRRYTIR
jgi:hypothetical protein